MAARWMPLVLEQEPDFTLLGFSPRLPVVNERRKTNARALDYERDRGGISFVRQF